MGAVMLSKLKAVSVNLLLLAIFGAPGAALAQSVSPSFPSAPPPVVSAPVIPVVPVQTQPVFPVFPVLPPPRTDFTLPLVPTDYTNASMVAPLGVSAPILNPANAVKKIDFNFKDPRSETEDGIMVKHLPGAQYERPQPAAIHLSEGTLLVSVRRPAHLAIVTTPRGDISIDSDAEVIIRYEDGILRVLNLSGLGEGIKVRIHGSEVSASLNGQSFESVKHEPRAMALKVGHELVSSDHALSRADLRPHDGVARRHFALLEDKCMAVSEFSLESALDKMTLLVDLQTKVSGVKERRILGDLAKMAAVLNYMNGAQGFEHGSEHGSGKRPQLGSN